MNITVRPLIEADISKARRVFSLAFGTFLGVDDPEHFRSDVDYVVTRWKADPSAAFVAEADGRVVGSNFATRWGSVGFFGPLTTDPALWDQGIGKRLMAPVMGCFDRWGVEHAGLYTFPGSVKHVGMYQKYGFWPRSLTAIMSREVRSEVGSPPFRTFSSLDAESQGWALDRCRDLTGNIYPGLRLDREIRAVRDQRLGDTVLVEDGDGIGAFAVCHMGPGTEAGSGTCYVKFAAVRPGSGDPQDPGPRRLFADLLSSCERLAFSSGLLRLTAGISTARHTAYRLMLEYGFRTDSQGVRMHRPHTAAYCREHDFVIDDWR